MKLFYKSIPIRKKKILIANKLFEANFKTDELQFFLGVIFGKDF